jgi:hypothetical protein
MKTVLKSRRAFVILALLAAPVATYGAAWLLDGIGFETSSFPLGALVFLVIAPTVLVTVGLGRAMTRTPNEIAAVAVVAVGTTFLVAVLLIAWALSQIETN